MRPNFFPKIPFSGSPRRSQPHVGIFWLLEGKLLIDSMPLNQAEPYGYHLTHPRNHLEVWTWFQQSGAVPADVEYEELPRGRVVYNTNTGQFTLLADKCILNEKKTIGKVITEMKLPENTRTERDDHYRCAVCLSRSHSPG